MIGAFAGSHPLSAVACPERDASSLHWAGYGKNDTGTMGERKTGADFTLVLEFPDGRFKIAVIQAKRDDTSTTPPGVLKIGQLKKVIEKLTQVVDGKVVETIREYNRNQVAALVSHASTLAAAHQRPAGLEHLTWVHYLCQHTNGVKAIPISQIRAEVQRSIDDNKVVSLFVDESKGWRLEDMLLSALADKSPAWLELRSPPEANLPGWVNLSGLLTLMPVVSAEGSDAKHALEVGDAVRTEISPIIEGISPGSRTHSDKK